MFTTTPFKPGTEGVWLDLPADVYHAAPGVSQSTLKGFDEAGSPLHFKTAPRKAATEDMKFGTVCHTAVLEPEKLIGSFEVRPDEYEATVKLTKKQIAAGETATTEIKKWNKNATYCDEWEAARADKIVLDSDKVAAIPRVVERVKKFKLFAEALSIGAREVSFFKRDPETGLLMKCRCDVLALDVDLNEFWIFDLKKVQTGCACEKEFQSSVMNFGYHIQDAWYRKVTGAQHMVFIPFDDEEPFDAAMWELPPDFIALGESECKRIYQAYADCVKTDTWPGYPGGVNSLPMPGYGKKRQMELNDIAFKDWSGRVARGLE